MTSRQRMLCAYRRQIPDQVPVSPELWYDMGILIDRNASWQDFCFGHYPLWRLQRSAHRHFGSAAWLLAAPGGGAVNGEIARTHRYTPEGDLEFHHVGRCGKGTLEWRVRNNATYYDWISEPPVKNLARDLAAFECLFLSDPETMEFTEMRDALRGVGEEGIVTAYVGALFFSYIAMHLKGGGAEAILAMIDNEALFTRFQERYIQRLRRITERIIEETDVQILLLENGYSTAGIISPRLYARWDVPVIRAVAEVVRQHDRLLHVHQHGKCRPFLDLIVACGPDLVEPFERPPAGDITDLRVVKEIYGERISLRGNLHSHATLLRGRPEDVEREVRECIEAAAAGGGYILASGDGVIAGTPFENIFRMVEAGEKYGRMHR